MTSLNESSNSVQPWYEFGKPKALPCEAKHAIATATTANNTITVEQQVIKGSILYPHWEWKKGCFAMGKGFPLLCVQPNIADAESYGHPPIEIDTSKTVLRSLAMNAKAAKPQARKILNRQHERAFIWLSDQTTVTCERTGISYSCALPAPAELNLETIHPFAFYQNVLDVVKQYGKQGLVLEEQLSSQVLAGMLLTALAHHGLLVCRDYVRANLIIAQASKATLGFIVRNLTRLTSGERLPALALHLEDMDFIDQLMARAPLTDLQKIGQQAEVLLKNYIAAVQGESGAIDQGHANATRKANEKKAQITVRVYSDPIKNALSKTDSAEAQAVVLLDRLEQRAKREMLEGYSSAVWSLFRSNTKLLTFLSEKAKQQMIVKIQEIFGTADKQAQNLIALYKGVDTSALEEDLLGWQSELEEEKTKWQAQNKVKVDFLSMLTKANKES